MSWNSTLSRKKPLTSKSGILRTASTQLARRKSMKSRKAGKKQRANKYLADMCHGQQCYLQIPGICRNDPETVVPAHSNQGVHGKGMGLKADDEKTCPGCFWCHAEIDQGHKFTKIEKFLIWEAGYQRWLPVRERLLQGGL
jgi:hypothetical protein